MRKDWRVNRGGSRLGSGAAGCTISADAGASAAGELGMRATGREPSSGVPGLVDFLERTSSAMDEHAALGPGLPEPMSEQIPSNEHRHSLPFGYWVVKRSVLGGLNHEYGLVKAA
jgi:hypothetical protein